MYKKIEWDCLKIISNDRFDKNMMVIGYKRGMKEDVEIEEIKEIQQELKDIIKAQKLS